MLDPGRFLKEGVDTSLVLLYKAKHQPNAFEFQQLYAELSN